MTITYDLVCDFELEQKMSDQNKEMYQHNGISLAFYFQSHIFNLLYRTKFS